MFVALLLAVIAPALAFSPRIIGGTSTTITKYPYQVSIHYEGELHCGGSLISANWILTAAHCVYGRKPALFKIRIASDYSEKEGILINGVAQIIPHEYFDEDDYDYDVALIKLPSPIASSAKAKPVTLATASTSVGTGSIAVVTGWGKTAPSGENAKKLQVLSVPIFDQKSCEKIYMYFNTVTARMLCAGFTTGGKDTCQGDSGGPLVYNGVQIGIVSWGSKCANPGYPGVYTRVSAIRSWITKRANV